MSEKEKQLVVTEVNFLRELRHPFIVKYYDRIIDKRRTKLYIVMECCQRGDLSQLISKCRADGTYLKEELIWKIFAQILLAIKGCHRHRDATGTLKPILHRDIKPQNIFMGSNHDVKLGDFGLAKELDSESKFAQTHVGTPYYMSPELVNQQKYNEMSDIWAVGCLVYELAALRPPFDAANQLALALKINKGNFARIPKRYSDSLQFMIQKMLRLRSHERPRVEELERQARAIPYLRMGRLSVKECSLNYRFALRERELRKREEALAAKEQDYKRRVSALKRLEKKQMHHNKEHRHKINRRRSADDVGLRQNLGPHNYQNENNKRLMK